jgi:hypothetical protein
MKLFPSGSKLLKILLAASLSVSGLTRAASGENRTETLAHYT